MGLLDPASKEPLFPAVLREMGDATGGGGAEADVGPFIGGRENPDPTPAHSPVDGPRLTEFWATAHALSCLRRGALSSSVEVTYNDAMATSLDGQSCLHGEMTNVSDYNRALHLDFARNVLGGSGVCCHIIDSGGIANTDDGRESGKGYKAAFCMHSGSKGRNTTSRGLATASDRQMETIARLSGRLLSLQTGVRSEDAPLPSSPPRGGEPPDQQGGWFQRPLTLASKVSHGVSCAIDRVLAAYDGDDDRFGPRPLAGTAGDDDCDDALYRSASVDDADDGADDAVAAMNGHANEDGALGNADEVISLMVVASCCRLVLDYLQTQSKYEQGAGEDPLFLRGQEGGIERVMLHRSGWDACSLGGLCRRAGTQRARDASECTEDVDAMKSTRLGDILSQMSQKGVDLLAATLCEANCAIIEKDVITVFPGGIPAGFEPCPTDGALFQIHATKVAIRHRTSRLERDAAAAKSNAVQAQTNGTTKLALAHARRRKAALDEAARGAALLANLDAAELRLERAAGDVQIVQSYRMLRTALRDVRSEAEGGEDVEGVEELMLDIREEMEATVEIGEDAAAMASADIDEDELNAELEKLERELEREGKASADNKAGEAGPNPTTDPRLEVAAEPRMEVEEATASKAEAVPV
ncbi:hypothetical protein ACHAXT_003750 [Thalassiosira profunda]